VHHGRPAPGCLCVCKTPVMQRSLQPAACGGPRPQCLCRGTHVPSNLVRTRVPGPRCFLTAVYTGLMRACIALVTEKVVPFFISSQPVHLARHGSGEPEQAAGCVASHIDWVLHRERDRIASASGRAYLRRNDKQCKGKARRPGEACGKCGTLPAALHRAKREMMCANSCLTSLPRAQSTRGRRCTGRARTATHSATCGTPGRPYVRPTLTGARQAPSTSLNVYLHQLCFTQR